MIGHDEVAQSYESRVLAAEGIRLSRMEINNERFHRVSWLDEFEEEGGGTSCCVHGMVRVETKTKGEFDRSGCWRRVVSQTPRFITAHPLEMPR